MPREGLTSVSLPDELIEKIDEFAENSDMGYSSRPDVIKTALREFFQRREGGDYDPRGVADDSSDD